MRAFRGYAYIVSWYDGDTFKGVLAKSGEDYEGSLIKPVRFRCAIINAPEAKGDTMKSAIVSRDWANNVFPPTKEYLCWHYGKDTYGRTLVELISPEGRQFSELSLLDGMSVPYGN